MPLVRMHARQLREAIDPESNSRRAIRHPRRLIRSMPILLCAPIQLLTAKTSSLMLNCNSSDHLILDDTCAR